MDSPKVEWVMACRQDREILVPLIEAFYAEERLHFDRGRMLPAIEELLDHPELGTVLILLVNGRIAGYLLATVGFSIEFGGKFVLLDELFILPEFRGRGWGKSGLSEIGKWARSVKAACLRLEVNHHNEKARSIYLKAGFIDDQRHLLTKWISASAQK